MAAGDVYQAAFEWLLNDVSVAQMVLHYIQNSGTDEPPTNLVQAIIAQMETAWANVDGNITDQCVFTECRLSAWDALEGKFNQIAVGTSALLDGSSGDEPLPFTDSLVVSFVTTIANRVAKKFLPGYVEDTQTSSIFSPAVVIAAINFGLDMIVDIDTGSGRTWTYGTWDRINEIFAPNIDIVQANAIVSHQIRRRPGTGI